MKTLYLYLADEYLGELAVDRVRGRETYMFRYDPAYLCAGRPLLDPAIRNVTGPQYPLTNGIFGFLADVAPDRWGRKLIRRCTISCANPRRSSASCARVSASVRAS